MPRKVGPNFEDRNRIREWVAEGASAEEISGYLNIEVAGVQIYMDSLKPKEELSPQQRGAITRAANKAAAEAAEEEEDGEADG